MCHHVGTHSGLISPLSQPNASTMIFFIILTKPIKLVDDILQQACHDEFGHKGRELDPLFIIDR